MSHVRENFLPDFLRGRGVDGIQLEHFVKSCLLMANSGAPSIPNIYFGDRAYGEHMLLH